MTMDMLSHLVSHDLCKSLNPRSLEARWVEPLSVIQSLSHPSGVRIASKNGFLDAIGTYANVEVWPAASGVLRCAP
jgi:hypothetical protein